MKNKILSYFGLLIGAIILMFLTSYIATFSHIAKYIAGGFIYMTVTYLLLMRAGKFFSPVGIIICLILPILIINTYLLTRGVDIRISIPSTASTLVGVFVGYLLTKISRTPRLTVLIVYVIICTVSAGPVYKYWAHWMNFGSVSPEADEALPDFELRTENGMVINKDSLYNKVIILDFWNTGCGPCYKKFPMLQDYKNKYKSYENVVFYSVNIPIRQETMLSMERRLTDYDFAQLLAPSDSTAKLFKVRVYPTVLLINNGRIIMRGELEAVERRLASLVTEKPHS